MCFLYQANKGSRRNTETWWDFSQLSGAGNVTEIILQPLLAKTKQRQNNYLYIIIFQHNIEFV